MIQSEEPGETCFAGPGCRRHRRPDRRRRTESDASPQTGFTLNAASSFSRVRGETQRWLRPSRSALRRHLQRSLRARRRLFPAAPAGRRPHLSRPGPALSLPSRRRHHGPDRRRPRRRGARQRRRAGRLEDARHHPRGARRRRRSRHRPRRGRLPLTSEAGGCPSTGARAAVRLRIRPDDPPVQIGGSKLPIPCYDLPAFLPRAAAPASRSIE